jgi:hypothetical protein
VHGESAVGFSELFVLCLALVRFSHPLQEEKVAEVERELNEAQFKVETAQGTFDTIVSRMATELARFQVRAVVGTVAALTSAPAAVQ